MKNSIVLKILASVLLFVSVIAFAASAITAYYVYESGAYYDGGTNITIQIGRDIARYHADKIGIHYTMRMQGTLPSGNIFAFDRQYAKENSNIRFMVVDHNGFEIFSNIGDEKYVCTAKSVYTYEELQVTDLRTMSFETLTEVEEFREKLSALESDILIEFTVSEIGDNEFPKYEAAYRFGNLNERALEVYTYIPVALESVDYIYWIFRYVRIASTYFPWIIGVSALSLLLTVLCAVFICCSAGHRRGSGEIRLGLFARLPIEIYLAVIVGLSALLSYVADQCYYSHFVIAIISLSSLVILIGALFSVSARLKSKKWYKNSVAMRIITLFYKYVVVTIFRFLKMLIKLLVRIDLYWKTALFSLLFLSIYILGAVLIWEGGILLILIAFTAQALLLIKFILDLRALEKTGAEICNGNMNSKIDTSKLLPSLRKPAESLNGIGAGLDKAVRQSINSERMRSELITNVSHDIKTPLTSIINYVALLKQDGLASEKAPEYLEVLDRQSARLKKMTEDLVEASKAASGNLAVNAENTDINIILSQALGEYEERLHSKHLNVVVRKDENANIVYADGRHTWRIFDNLLSNICKYALAGTRVFIETERKAAGVQVTFKNISAEPLEHSAEELTERFVRGDSSRNTEGSGLGLSIAKSLAELQCGAFDILTDGDMFKVTVTFRVID